MIIRSEINESDQTFEIFVIVCAKFKVKRPFGEKKMNSVILFFNRVVTTIFCSAFLSKRIYIPSA